MKDDGMNQEKNGIEIVERSAYTATRGSKYQDLIDALKQCGEGQAVRFARADYPNLKGHNLQQVLRGHFPQHRIRYKTESATHFLVWLEPR